MMGAIILEVGSVVALSLVVMVYQIETKETKFDPACHVSFVLSFFCFSPI